MIRSQKKIRWAEHVARMGGVERFIQSSSGETWGEKRPLGRPRRRWEDNIKIGLREVMWGMDWIDLAENVYGWRVFVNSVVNIGVA